MPSADDHLLLYTEEMNRGGALHIIMDISVIIAGHMAGYQFPSGIHKGDSSQHIAHYMIRSYMMTVSSRPRCSSFVQRWRGQ